ncbi:hypothetical protein J6590_033168 [Homalodisca vitripennis]|nr:hypothetical protein J6590_033168 [Homalodisca vitripennis]
MTPAEFRRKIEDVVTEVGYMATVRGLAHYSGKLATPPSSFLTTLLQPHHKHSK